MIQTSHGQMLTCLATSSQHLDVLIAISSVWRRTGSFDEAEVEEELLPGEAGG